MSESCAKRALEEAPSLDLEALEAKRPRSEDCKISAGKLYQLWGAHGWLTPEQRAALRHDETAVYSVTDSRTAERITKRVLALEGAPFEHILDGCACVGGNVVSFARALAPSGGRVTAVELDRTRFEMLEDNVRAVQLEGATTCFCGDVAQLTAAAPEEADACTDARRAVRACDLFFLDPPWGGPEVDSMPKDSVELQMSGVPVSELCRRVAGPDFAAKHLVLKLPPNYKLAKLKSDLADLAHVDFDHKLRKMVLAIVSFRRAPPNDDETTPSAPGETTPPPPKTGSGD